MTLALTQVSSREGALMAYSGQSIDEGDVREAWSKKWAASEAVAEEANDEKARLASISLEPVPAPAPSPSPSPSPYP